MKIFVIGKEKEEIKETKPKKCNCPDKIDEYLSVAKAVQKKQKELEEAIPEVLMISQMSDDEIYEKYKYTRISELSKVTYNYLSKRYGQFIYFAIRNNKSIGQLFEDVINPCKEAAQKNNPKVVQFSESGNEQN